MTKKIEGPFLRTAYNYDTNEASDETGLDCRYDLDTGEEIESMTKQSFAEECDINTIVRRFGVTGELPTGLRAPTYGDFDQVNDYQSALNAVRQAAETFMEMPAEVRARFNNDPQRFLEFTADDKNRDEAQKMGLLVPQAVDLAIQAATATTPATAAKTGSAGEKATPQGGVT